MADISIVMEKMSDSVAETIDATDSSPKPEAEERPFKEEHSKTEEIEQQQQQQQPEDKQDKDREDDQPATQQETVEQSQEQQQPEKGEQQINEPEEPEEPRKLTFLDYLKSPIVELVVGQGEKKTTLTAHQALLAESPYIREIIESEDTPVGQIFLPEESVEAVGCFLQYQYKGEYIVYPSETDGDDAEEYSGEELLRHARVFFLASKFGHDELKRLARHKIHRVESTPRGEIAYARYVYGNKSPAAAELRRPVANFWASNEALRDEVREEFKAVCLDFPEFSYDILSSNKKRPASGTPMKEDRQAAVKRRRSRRN
ncbi:GPI transamidase component [Ascosphaera pollenicola]|nr:GPI transamidase component [Ascosphaera pollenicola]